ncbi:hypothetical protein EDB92DRAFT_2075767 [Lactarius akahatsu]|uniref:Uncharacterized protein n=1 Tax=Lactarius akahatsu TaxID=416441 RepID=A0AAD4L350_9AGAM|nr:hypothetical protein EDB92DRAFT_2075767 [Lactarius akahatsu]
MMRKLFYVLSFLLAATALVLPSVPSPSHSGDGSLQATFRVQSGSNGPDREWNSPPNPNSTHHLIFNSVSSLLQRWPNTFRRNGHSLVPATIPKGTILYHGRTDGRIPNQPDWFAFDFEHSYLFCFQSCYVISLQAKRDLRLVYFDGSSAAKMKDGPMDSQDVLLWGRPQPDKASSERERIKALCDWGRPFGLDGFIRMEFHFEVMICDVLDPMEIVTFLAVLPKKQMSTPRRPPGFPPLPKPPIPIPLPPPSKPPPGWHGSLPSDHRSFLEAYLAGGWHDRAPGETRVHLDYSGLVTYYDTSLTSLIESRHGKDRLHLRLEGISVLDSERIRAELQTVLTREQDGRSGIDWGSIARVVTERYAGRLEYLRFLLSPNTTFADPPERATIARTQLLVMLAPYVTTTDVPERLPASADLSWAAPIAQRCATAQTSHIPLGLLTPQEARIHAAVENTLQEICRRLVVVWVEFFDVEAADEARATDASEMAHEQISELMAWLDWSVWVRCEPRCGLGEVCYVPTWPFPMGGDPYDMTPRCVSLEDTTD